jgi:hypothetical protein
MKKWRTFSANRATQKMTRKLRRNGLRLFVTGYFGEYYLYKPHPVYEYFGHQPLENLGPDPRKAWDRINEICESADTLQQDVEFHYVFPEDKELANG